MGRWHVGASGPGRRGWLQVEPPSLSPARNVLWIEFDPACTREHDGQGRTLLVAHDNIG